MNIKIRLENEKDYKEVENLTREAFWNLHQPGCDEHLGGSAGSSYFWTFKRPAVTSESGHFRRG